MKLRSSFAPAAALPAALLSFGLLPSAFAQVAPSHVAPAIERFAKNLGQESPSTPLNLTVWLNLHNRADLDTKVAALYDTKSNSFHKWLQPSDLKSYAPTGAEVDAVKKELIAHNLAVTSVDSNNFFIRFTGNTSDVEAAFHTQVQRNMLNGMLVHSTTTAPALSGAAAGLVSHLGGLNSAPMQPFLRHPINPATQKPFPGVPVSKTSHDGTIFSAQCFFNPASVTVSGTDAISNAAESITMSGLTYGASPSNTVAGTLAPCGYSPSDVATIYGLNQLYQEGYNGYGQTVVVIDPYLEPTIQSDMDTFNANEGLNDVTINVINPLGATLDGTAQGWNQEADLDVEWSHAVARGANITLLEAATSDNEDLQAAILYVVTNKLGNVVSNSYGSPESYGSPLSNNIWNQILEMAAAEGISVHFATGDSGDYTVDGIPADVSSPADSPYATAVGGTSVSLAPDNTVLTTGWGTNITELTIPNGGSSFIYPPPSAQFFSFGAGGGTSAFFAKPSYQSGLSGNGRHLPDVSALADPYTGAEFVYTSAGLQYIGAIGGTSLATPIFSGMWAILDETQPGLTGSLGQAAPLIAYGAANTPFITDVVGQQGPANVSASITAGTTTDNYSPTQLAGPLQSTNAYASGLWNLGGSEYFVVTFGTDSGLSITQGWDAVTGYGTPNMGAIASLIALIPQ